MQRLLLLGLNHATAPLAVRERLAFNEAQRRAAVLAFRERFPDAEAVLLSTCNRVELYAGRAVHGRPRVEEMVEFLAGFHGVDASVVRPHLYEKANADVVRHLFTVASSLDSMVLGETQIIGQVRAILAAGIPFIGHLGMLPQHILEEGRYRVKGKVEAERAALLADAEALAAIDAFGAHGLRLRQLSAFIVERNS